MQKSDLVRLRHMLDAAQDAISFVRNRSRSELDSDRMLTLALIKTIEIVGEAAARVSGESQVQYAEIPWVNIIAMRNRLIHTYYEVDLDILWNTVKDDLPPLIASLEEALLQP